MNISSLKNCYGCGVCVAACPFNIIALKENGQGFYSPVIEDQERCVNCGICLEVCAFNHPDPLISGGDIKGFAGWSNSGSTREWCSSGGVGFEIGKFLIESGYKACGVRYNISTRRAEHFIASTVEEFMASAGSKYIPSNTLPAFAAIDKRQKYAVIGTPCQIDSFRRYICHFKCEKNFVLIDFFCHGVPSLLMWDSYLQVVNNKIGNISFVKWRNKNIGKNFVWSYSDAIPADGDILPWHKSYNIKMNGENGSYLSQNLGGDLFYKFFLGNYCLNKCCHKSCKNKQLSSSADIRIGDFWGEKYSSEQKGVTAILTFTDRGREIIRGLDSCTIIPEDIECILEGQMSQNANEPFIRGRILKNLQNGQDLRCLYGKLIKPYEVMVLLPKRIICKLKRILLKLFRTGVDNT